MKQPEQRKLSNEQSKNLLKILERRFEENTKRHKSISWEKVREKLEDNPHKLWSLFQMEETGGEPDIVGLDAKSNEYIFYDCAAESPKGRRSFCYDNAALEARKEHKPKNSAMGMAEEIGVELLTEAQYRELHTLGKFDTKTSSWLKTPSEIRYLVIFVLILSSFITTACSRIMREGDLGRL